MSLGGVQQLSRVCGTKPDLCVVACERGLPPSRLWYRCRIWHIPCPINSKIAEYLFILSFPLICLLISVLLSVWYTHFFVGDALYSSASLVVTLQVYMRVGGRVLHFARPTGKRSPVMGPRAGAWRPLVVQSVRHLVARGRSPAVENNRACSFNNILAGMRAFDIVTKSTVTVGQCQHGSCINF